MLTSGAYPLMDGRCQEYEALNAEQVEVSSETDLYIFQDDHYVWLCHTTPSAGMSWDDIELFSPNYANGLNLHASAQLGEWPLDEPAAQPKTSSSDLWWRVEGWWANTPGPNGMEEVNGRRQTKWMDITAREYQLSKDRFGRGEWMLRFHFHMADDGGGVIYPAAEKPLYALNAE
ncbi:hypothetical protein [Hyphococcus sp.]|uniref:hypothetical protein n=1 Tax=Hyphococcus sp. TaxID=2038636 RepID=UPI003CCBE442